MDRETTEEYHTLTVQEGLAELLKTLRGLRPMPIPTLSTSALADKLQTVQTRADDFPTKPFETEECPARIHALLSRFYELNPLKMRAYSIVGPTTTLSPCNPD